MKLGPPSQSHQMFPFLHHWLTKVLEANDCQNPIHDADIILGATRNEYNAFKIALI